MIFKCNFVLNILFDEFRSKNQVSKHLSSDLKKIISSRLILDYDHVKMSSALVHTVPNNLVISSYLKWLIFTVISKKFILKKFLSGYKFKVFTYQSTYSKNFSWIVYIFGKNITRSKLKFQKQGERGSSKQIKISLEN